MECNISSLKNKAIIGKLYHLSLITGLIIFLPNTPSFSKLYLVWFEISKRLGKISWTALNCNFKSDVPEKLIIDFSSSVILGADFLIIFLICWIYFERLMGFDFLGSKPVAPSPLILIILSTGIDWSLR